MIFSPFESVSAFRRNTKVVRNDVLHKISLESESRKCNITGQNWMCSLFKKSKFCGLTSDQFQLSCILYLKNNAFFLLGGLQLTTTVATHFYLNLPIPNCHAYNQRWYLNVYWHIYDTNFGSIITSTYVYFYVVI